MPELGKFQIIARGALLVLQRFEGNSWGRAWEDYGSGKNLDELLKFFLKARADHYNDYNNVYGYGENKNPHHAVDSSVPPYITEALRYIEQLMRRRGG